MKELIGKECKIIVNFYGEKLFYHARILYINEFMVTFIDKFKKIYMYNLQNVIEVKEVKDNEKKEAFWEKGDEKDGVV